MQGAEGRGLAQEGLFGWKIISSDSLPLLVLNWFASHSFSKNEFVSLRFRI